MLGSCLCVYINKSKVSVILIFKAAFDLYQQAKVTVALFPLRPRPQKVHHAEVNYLPQKYLT